MIFSFNKNCLLLSNYGILTNAFYSFRSNENHHNHWNKKFNEWLFQWPLFFTEDQSWQEIPHIYYGQHWQW
jgi:hypothetical protein